MRKALHQLLSQSAIALRVVHNNSDPVVFHAKL
jgi:hypothetical protein